MRRSKTCHACGQKFERDREHVLVQFKPYARRVTFHRACFDPESSVYYRVTYVSDSEPLLLIERDS